MQKIKVKPGAKIEDYKAYGSLYTSVLDFLEQSKKHIKTIEGRTIWMINSTAIGGGVAEMLPSQMRILRELGVSIEWLVIEASENAFFDLTKRIHNAIHGSGNGIFTDEDRKVYENVNQQNLDRALELINDGDIVVVHDPQPMPLAAMIKKEKKVAIVWRCHIGLEEDTPVTDAVWEFLSPYTNDYDHFVFSLPAYVPKGLKNRTSIIPPAIDPLSHKNRALQIHKCIGILYQSGILEEHKSILYDRYNHLVRRVLPNGDFGDVNELGDLGFLYRPIITEISRWDRLKGFRELMKAFIKVKLDNRKNGDPNSLEYKRIEMTLLVLGGPDPAFVSDDPEGQEVLKELTEEYQAVDNDMQNDIAILLLPLDNPKENALIVNALQRSSSIVVQNSIQEGFGLTATEAMWKRKPVLVSGAAGLKFQVEHNKTGKINNDPTDIKSLAEALSYMVNHPKERDKWGFNGQLRVVKHFTLFSQLVSWLEVFAKNKD
ncbi:glycosyltransferase [Flagellimonas nanhaiensis]|uniref:Glycosyltransferase n=1 Tax=Flagellimonas nanhaiensis TaxID=2292706 RepID=A0A371JSP7_9FLAO|nr:glycosyltransferase [Allomuricauda nanhaiensis]RDY60828.1 glycosyltransferase [Allomuricauda nanhaiensis]